MAESSSSLTFGEAAALLGCTVAEVQAAIWRGDLSAFTVAGGRLLLARQAVAVYHAANGQ